MRVFTVVFIGEMSEKTKRKMEAYRNFRENRLNEIVERDKKKARSQYD